jgi:putative ABC transport system permease protein
MSRSRLDGSAAARRAVLRWAYRLARRDWRQYTVIVVLLTIAVAGSTLVATTAYNIAPAAEDAEFGDASHVLYLDGDISADEITQWVAAGVDSFGTVDPIGHHTVAVPGTTHSVDYRAQAIDGPYSGPMLTVREGRAPATTGEAAITDGVASMLSLTIDDTIDIDGTARKVVGLVENPSKLNDEFVLVPPSEIANSDSVAMLMNATDAQLRHFGDEIGGGIRLGERSKVPEDVLAGVLTLLASTVVLLLVALIASASFTVIAQRRIPQYGMLSAIGGSERHIRLTVLASGALIGTVAAVGGVVAGIGGWLALAPAMDSLVDHRVDTTNIPWWIVITGALLAIAAATGAAWWPARAMSRIPTVAALSGRTPQRTRPHRSALLALVLLVIGIVGLHVGSDFGDGGPSAFQAVLLVVGTLTVLAGVLFLCPILIGGLGRVATTVPVSGRLALRDLSRHQARSSAALAAIGLALGIPSVIVASVAAGENASPLGNLSSTQVLIHASDIDGPFAPDAARLAEVQAGVDEIVTALGEPRIVRLDTFVDPTTPPDPKSGESLTLSVARQVSDGWEHVGTVFAATPELLAAIGVDPATVAGSEVVTSATGDLVMFGAGGAFAPDRRSVQPLTRTGTLPENYTSLPSALFDPAQAGPRGLDVVPSGLWLIDTSRPIAKADLDNAREIAARHGFRIETRDDRSNLRMIRLAAGLTGTLLALGVMAATLGLIRGESANDVRTLTAAGARPSTRRGIAAVTAGTLAAVGALLGIASSYIGLVAAGVDHLMPVPWADLAIIAVATPLLATVVAWMVGGREPAAIARRPLD